MTVRKTTRGAEPHLVIDIWYRDSNGERQRYRRDAQVQTMTAARAEERRLLTSLAEHGTLEAASEPVAEAPKVDEPAPATFEDAVEYFRNKKALTLKPSTRFAYDFVIDASLLPRLKSKPLVELQQRDFAELDADLARRKVKPSTRRNHIVVLRSVLRAAKVGGLLERMPDMPPLPKVGSKVVRVPFPAEIAAVIGAALPHQRVALALASYAGLRAGEIRGLRKRDVDLDGGVLVVRQAICRGVAAPPKSGHEREIPIAAALKPFLVDALTRCPTFDAPVSPSDKGTVWSEPGLRNVLEVAQRKAGVKGWSLHALRHAFVSTLFRKGASAPVVQKLAGHIHLSVTQRYAHTTREDLQAAIAAL
jgi:integrase